MQLYAGVKFYLGDGITERTGFIRVDFERLIAWIRRFLSRRDRSPAI